MLDFFLNFFRDKKKVDGKAKKNEGNQTTPKQCKGYFKQKTEPEGKTFTFPKTRSQKPGFEVPRIKTVVDIALVKEKEVKHYALTADGQDSLGMICGGQVTVVFERV